MDSAYQRMGKRLLALESYIEELRGGEVLKMGFTRPGKLLKKNYGKSPCLMGKSWKITMFNGKIMENHHF